VGLRVFDLEGWVRKVHWRGGFGKVLGIQMLGLLGQFGRCIGVCLLLSRGSSRAGRRFLRRSGCGILALTAS
jgi:hypothetical protein